MSKLSFRARALDASKPLPVFRCEDLPDLHEYASINRAVPQMPTGMEKEEESVRFAAWKYAFTMFASFHYFELRPLLGCAGLHKMAAIALRRWTAVFHVWFAVQATSDALRPNLRELSSQLRKI